MRFRRIYVNKSPLTFQLESSDLYLMDVYINFKDTISANNVCKTDYFAADLKYSGRLSINMCSNYGHNINAVVS